MAGGGPARQEPEATRSSAGASGKETGGGAGALASHCSPLSPPPPPPGVIALFCRQYDIIKDNEPNNSKEKTKSASETSTPEHQGGGLLRSKVSAGLGPGWAAPGLQQGQRGAGCACSWAEPSSAAAGVTQGTLHVDFGPSPMAGCQGPVGLRKCCEWGGQNAWLVWDSTNRGFWAHFGPCVLCDLEQVLHLFVPSFPLLQNRYENLVSACSEPLRRDGREVRGSHGSDDDYPTNKHLALSTFPPPSHLLTPPGLLSSLLASLFLAHFPEAS